MVSYEGQYGALLRRISDEADAMSLECFRNSSLRVERKMDGTALTQADGAVEKMARKRVAESGLALDVYGEEQGTGAGKSEAANGGTAADGKGAAGRARLIIDPIDGTEEFSRGIPTFGTLLGIELNGEIVAGMCSAPALGTLLFDCPLGARVSEGQLLARILASPGEESGEVEVRAPASGLLLIRARDRLARPGETIATLITDRPAKGAAVGRTLSNR